MKRLFVAAGAALGAFALGTTALAGTNTTNLPNGAALSVSVDSPVGGATFLVPQGQTDVDVPVSGTAAVGVGAPNAAWIYVFDVSGSTGGACAGTTIIACERQAVTNLNNAVIADGSALEVGIVAFASAGVTADMALTTGNQSFVAPNSSGVATVIGSVNIGGIGQFTARSVGSGSTNFEAGLLSALSLVNVTSAAQKNVVFLSDGASNAGSVTGFNTALTSLAGAGAKVFPFAVGSGASCTGGSAGTLAAMATATGTSCVNVPDPATLPAIITNLTATQLSTVSLTIDAAGNALDSLSPAVPAAGPVTANYAATAADQAPGTHTACATATGVGPASDPTKTGTVTRCEDYDVYGFALTPATATNELGSDNIHTVTATLSGAAGKLGGFGVAFTVTGQNAGAVGTCAPVSCATDASGIVTFTYSVPKVPASLGTDTISGTVTVGAEQGTASVQKLWRDTTPPVASCPQTTNPGGSVPQAPGKGGSGQNQDGFYRLTATDDVWPAGSLQMYVKDTGSGTVFGPFPVGTDIKYTQATGGQPSIKAMDGEVEWHITGTGDALVTAVDGSGNVSSGAACLVPKPLK